MPITVTITEGLLSAEAERHVFAALTDAFLRRHNLVGNRFLTPNVIGEIATIPAGRGFAGGRPADIAIVELKVPSFALATPEQKAGFIADATEILVAAAGGRLAREAVWVNMVHAVDGLWGIAGRAYSNEALIQAVAA